MRKAAPSRSGADVFCAVVIYGSLLSSLGGCDGDAGTSYGRHDGAAAYPGPGFRGAGTSLSGASIAAGPKTIDCATSSPPVPFAPNGSSVARRTCYYADDPRVPAATVEWIVESAKSGDDAVHVRLTLNPAFVDNTYGAESIGWNERMKAPKPMDAKKPARDPGTKAPHTFRDLVGSDHAEFKLSDAQGKLVLHFKTDYLSESSDAQSGYATLGVRGGEGKVLVGSVDDVLAVSTSLDRNLNVCGLDDFMIDSPATDASYTPNPLAPRWDYRVVYDVWVRAGAFAGAGFGAATVDFVHASPSKLGSNTLIVVEKPCDPGKPYCDHPNGCECFVADGSCIPRETPEDCFVADGTCNPGKTPPPPPADEQCSGLECGI